MNVYARRYVEKCTNEFNSLQIFFHLYMCHIAGYKDENLFGNIMHGEIWNFYCIILLENRTNELSTNFILFPLF